MDAPLTLTTVVILALILSVSVGAISFLWPANAFRRGAWAVVSALAGPIVVGFLIEPFLGSGAGLGVALILYFFAAAILLGAVAAIVGAASRYLWDGWHRAKN